MNVVLILASMACVQTLIILPEPCDKLIVEAASQVLLETFNQGFDTFYLISLLTSTDYDTSAGLLVQRAARLLPVIVESIGTKIKTSSKQRFNVILMDSEVSLDLLRVLIMKKNFDTFGNFLILLLSEAEAGDLCSQVFHVTAHYLIYNVNIIYRIHKSIASYTYFPYGTPGDHLTRMARWNTFIQTGFVSPKLHFPPKFKNFFGASLGVALFKTTTFMDFSYDEEDNIVNYRGVDGTLLKTIALALNFTIRPIIPNNNQRWGTLNQNGTATGAMGLLLNGTVNLTLGFFGNNYLRQQYLTGTQSHYQTSLILCVTPGSAHGSFEKLLLPFQFNLWAWFAAMLTIAIFVIVLLQFLPKYVQHFIWGRMNRTPGLNLFQTTIGNPANPAPSRNFARFLLTIWMLATFVLRSAYQQIMFYNFHHSQNHSIVRDWDEFIASKYRIFVIPPERYLLDNLHDHIQRQITIIPTEQANATLQAIRYGFLRGARISYPESLYYQNLQVLNNGGPFYRQFGKRLYSYTLSVFFRKNSPLVDPFNGQIQPLVTYGFVEHWRRELLNRNLQEIIRTRMRRARATALSVPILSGIFELYALGMVGAMVAFLVEICIARFEHR